MKKSLSFPFLLFSLLLAPAATAQEAPPPIYNLVRVHIESPTEIPPLQLMGLDIIGYGENGVIDVVARDRDLGRLDAAGFAYDVMIRDMASFYAKRLEEEPKPKGRTWPNGSMNGYYTLSEIETMLDDWAAQYPGLISSKTSIGTTVEGRNIWAVKISDNPGIDENEPECCFDALIHAREPEGMMTLLYYMKNLLEQYGVDPELTYLVDNREIWFIPVHNPDGYRYNEQTNPNGGGMWRKNRRNNGSSHGVDLNRNYGFKWGYDNYGSSPDPSSETYRGPFAFSEPETQAVSSFILGRPIVTSWNTHTYSDLYLCPFGYDDVLPYGNDWPIYQEYLADISAKNGYVSGPIYSTIYAANGGSTDWQYAVGGVFNIAPEIGNSGDGFWPPYSRIVPLAEENFSPIKYWTWVAGSAVTLEDHALADDNGDGLYYPGEPVDVTLTLRNKGLAATVTDVTATISSTSPYVTIIDGSHDFGTIPSVTNADNSAHPLKIKLNSDTPYGEAITLDVAVTFDGYTLDLPLSFVCGAPQVFFHDDFETNQGWTVTNQNLQTGAWERAVPNPTSGQQVAPLEDNPAGTGTYCYVTENGPPGGSYSSYDIDGGPTILTSPVIDLSSGDAVVSLYAWYYSRDSNDPFKIDVSNDNGATWTNVFTTSTSLSGWAYIDFDVNDYVTPTAQVKVRVSAQDQPNNDIVEAGLDDFEVKNYTSPISLALSAPPKIGTSVNVLVSAPSDPGSGYFMAASTDTYPAYKLGNRYVPLNYDWLTQMSMTPGNGVFFDFSGVLDGSGSTAAPRIDIPNNPGLVGMEIYVVALTLNSSGSPKVKNISAPLPITIE